MISRVLSDEQIEKIHQASLCILERVGVVVPHEDMLGRFADSGAKVDFKEQRVRIPADLVLRSVERAGKQFTLYGRDLTKTAPFGQGQRNYNSIAGEGWWLDTVAGERRHATLEDVATAACFADALEEINIPGAMSDPFEISIEARCVEVLATMIRNTTKPVNIWYHDRASARFIVEMLIALRGDQKSAARYPLCYPFFEPISPLRFPFNGIDLLFETARLNMPVPIGPMAQMGLSAPAAVAGTMAQENAEILAGICITQLVREGMPVCYGGICHAFDMTTTQLIFCGPEQAIFGVGMTQIGKRYGLPVYINVGLTDSKRPDAQAGLEAGVTLALGASAGADVFGHMGISGVDQASSLDMLVLQCEVISYVESLCRRIDFSDEALGIGIIEEVGPGGNFIDTMHTVEHFRRELWFPKLLDREYYQAWLDNGGCSLEDRCLERKEKILAEHEPEPVSPDLERALDEIVAAAKRELLP
ncbi:MAG: trimethylamine methyltransferase family protein [Gemmatimonadota bacterium]|nr:trimethylamine methyltransferase family protein [Gemmatimonadota bacterium]